ncbi:MAG: DUF1810 domain-containing protein [Lacunisphaera sp.]
MHPVLTDPFDLSRFVTAQEGSYQTALNELRAGKKRSHWMWYVFPQFTGLGVSAMAKKYAIQSRAEAEAFHAHAILGPRLEECAETLLGVEGRSAEQIVGFPDFVKLCSSMTLFAEVTPPGSIFERVLGKYYAGLRDEKTLEFIGPK